MNGDWIKFSEREPEHSQLIWAASVVECPICTRYSIGTGRLSSDYTHWMPCERPAQPLPEKSPEELALEDHLSTHPLTTFEETWHTALRWERNRKK